MNLERGGKAQLNDAVSGKAHVAYADRVYDDMQGKQLGENVGCLSIGLVVEDVSLRAEQVVDDCKWDERCIDEE